VLAFVMVAPAPGELTERVPGDAGDPLLLTWIMRSVLHGIPEGWGELWQTNAFNVPSARLVLAYSDTLLPLAPVFGFLSWITRSPALAYNLVIVAAWVVSLWSTDRLARRVIGSEAGALVAAVAFSFSTVRLVHYRHLQLAWGALIPLALLLLLRLLERPTVRRGLALGAVTAGLTLIASYYGLLVLLIIVLVVLVHVVRTRAWRPLVAPLVAAGAFFVVVVGPFALQYIRLLRDPQYRRDPEPRFFAHLSDFVSTDPDNRFVGGVLSLADRGLAKSSENWLFPGFVCTALALVGLVAWWRRGVRRGGELALLVAAGALGLIMAAGHWAQLGDRRVTLPYDLLADVVPGLGGVRVTARFFVVTMLVLALLAGAGFGLLTRGRDRRLTVVLAALVIAAVLFEGRLRVETIALEPTEESAAVNHELADRPDGLVLELPMQSGASGAAWNFVEGPRMVASTIDWMPRVNGVSGFQPGQFDDLAPLVNLFPAPNAFAAIDDLGVRYVIIRTTIPMDLGPHRRPQFERDGAGVFDDDHARAIIDAIPDDRVERVQHLGSAYLIELQPAAGDAGDVAK
jgi:MFS family permease